MRSTARSESCRTKSSLADVGHQRHEARAFDRVLDGALEGGAVAAAFAAKEFALAGAELFEALNVLVIDEHGAGTPFFGAETTAVFTASSELLANHRYLVKTSRR